MGRKGNGEGDEFVPRAVKISTGDEPPEVNATLLRLLSDGEKPKPGEPGTLADRLGWLVQDFMAVQSRAARHSRKAVKGTLTLKILFVSGPDGSHQYAVEDIAKPAKVPVQASMTFADETGEITGRPVEPLTEEMYRREKTAGAKSNGASPKSGDASGL